MGFDWHEFLASDPLWSLTEVVHRKAVREGAGRGLDVRPTDVPTDTVVRAVRSVLEEMDADAELRPSHGGFCAEQARRGDLGRQTQQDQASLRKAQVFELVASGVTSNAEIARRLGVHRSTVGRTRGNAKSTSSAGPRVEALAGAEPVRFPAPAIPRCERWPVNQFMLQTGVALEAEEARWLANMGHCYEAEGRVDDLMHAIRASAGANVCDPWAYLQRCVANRGDTWVVTPRLVTDVLVWAGEDSLRYALTAISGGYVRRPRAYVERSLSARPHPVRGLPWHRSGRWRWRWPCAGSGRRNYWSMARPRLLRQRRRRRVRGISAYGFRSSLTGSIVALALMGFRVTNLV